MMQRILSGLVCLVLVLGGSTVLTAQDPPPDGVPPEGVPPEEGGQPDGVPPEVTPPDNEPNGGDGRAALTSRHLLLPPEDGSGSGDVFLKENPTRGAIHVLVRGLAAGETYDVTIANGMSELLGSITTQPDDGSEDAPGTGKLRLDTNRGDSLPLGAESIADLVGTSVTVTAADGTVVLSTEIVDLSVHTPGRDGIVPPDDEGDAGEGGALVAPLTADFLVPGLHDATFLRGDANMDGGVNIADPINTLNMLFGSHALPYCLDAVDSNDDGDLDIADALATLIALFNGGTLPAPSGEAGTDPTPDTLFCDAAGDSTL